LWQNARARNSGLRLAMRPTAIFAFAVMLVSLPATAYAQAGSIGGTVGKQDKSISGRTTPEESNPPVSKPNSVRSLNPSQRQPERIPLVTGQYDVVASGYSSTFTITVSNSKFSGSSKWACCPGLELIRSFKAAFRMGELVSSAIVLVKG
jgi:hypothetical protein